MKELKPCPFCGGRSVSLKAMRSIWGDDQWYTMKCEAVGCTYFVAQFGLENAINVWNERSER